MPSHANRGVLQSIHAFGAPRPDHIHARARSNLGGNNLIGGPLPDALGSLSALLVLELSYNFISGTIPNSLVALSSLRDWCAAHSVARTLLERCPRLVIIITRPAQGSAWEPALGNDPIPRRRAHAAAASVRAGAGANKTTVLRDNIDYRQPTLTARRWRRDFGYNALTGALPDLGGLTTLQWL